MVTPPRGGDGRSTSAPTADTTSTTRQPPTPAPACFGHDYEPDDHEDCGGCPFRGPCAQRCLIALGHAHRLGPGDLGYYPSLVGRNCDWPLFDSPQQAALVRSLLAAAEQGLVDFDQFMESWTKGPIRVTRSHVIQALELQHFADLADNAGGEE